jgi:hypothetical protein
MKVEIEIQESEIVRVATFAVRKGLGLEPGNYGANQVLSDAVNTALRAPYFRALLNELVGKAAVELAPQIVRDVVKDYLRQAAKRVVSEAKKEGRPLSQALFGATPKHCPACDSMLGADGSCTGCS